MTMNKPLDTRTPDTEYSSAQRGLMRVFVNQLALPVNIGIHPHEKNAPQTVLFTVDLAISELGQPSASSIDDVVCYETICNKIRGLVAHGHIDLVETLAEKVAALCLANNKVVKARVRIEKPDAIEEACSVGVEIERLQRQK